MNDPNSQRRDFLKSAALGATGAMVGGCRLAPALAGSEARMPLNASLRRLPDRPAPPAQSEVFVTPTADHAGYAEAIDAAIEKAGGLKFIREGESVLLKPATNSAYRYPATTDPETVLLVAQKVIEAGGKPIVADRTMFLRSTETTFKKLGILEAANAAGARARFLEDESAVTLRHPLAANWRKNRIRIYASALEVDHIVNLCTPRTHFLGGFTMAMKNNVGLVNALSRLPMHAPFGLKERLAEVNLVVKPSMILMDGREGFVSGGPDYGDLAKPGFIAVSTDPLAIDAVGLAYLRLEGATPEISEGSIWEIPQMKRAAEIGIGASNEKAIKIEGLGVEETQALRKEMA